MSCFHCGQKITSLTIGEIKDKEQQFCCSGCLTVCKIISDNNLDNFYEQENNKVKPIFDNIYPLEYYNLDDFKNEFTANNQITLISPSIHCAACIWLIEKTLSKIPEVINIRANLSNNRIHIKFSQDAKLANIFEKLSILGYGSEPLMENSLELIKNKQNKVLLARIGFAGFAMMNLLWVSISLYSGADKGNYNSYFLWLSFILATPTLFYSGFGFLQSSFTAIKNLSLNMDVPITIGALVTYFYSSLVLFEIVDGEIYFDTVVNFIFIILIGRYLESSVKKSVVIDNNSFTSINPRVATLIKGDKNNIISVNALKKDDNILVKTGERIAADGVIVSGNLSVDEAIITGESLPVNKKKNDNVYAGTLNLNGSGVIKVLKTNSNSFISKIKQLVEDASLTKPKIECTIDKIIPYFVVTTISIAIFSFLYHYNFGFDKALLASVSVLIITCPCAFGIAVPITNAIASSLLLKNRIIVKNADIFENLTNIDYVVFDKTGTLTTGDFIIKKISTTIEQDKFLQIVASICKFSHHPLSKSINNYYQKKLLTITNFKDKNGLGLSANINNLNYKIGSYEFVTQKVDNKNSKDSTVWVAQDNNILGNITLSDEINKDMQKVISFLKNKNKKIIILSGDNKFSVKKVANFLKIDKFYYNQKPIDKLNFITKLQKNYKVLMIGDGVNDTPVLAKADCSIAISGVDIVGESANCNIVKNNIASIIKLFTIASLSKKIIRQNITFALAYNLIFIPLAFLGLITPIFAAIVMPISSIVVIVNSLRLKFVKFNNEND